MEKMEKPKPKYGIEASFKGEDSIGKYVAIPVLNYGEYIVSQSFLDKDEVIYQKYPEIKRITGHCEPETLIKGSDTIIFRLYYE